MYYIIGAAAFFILTYYFRNNIIYYFILYYDKLLSFKQNKITFTGINNIEMNEFNYLNYNEYFNYDIILVNFTINNKYKRLISTSICENPTNNIDFSKLNYMKDYISPIILVTIDLLDTNINKTIKDIDITSELNEFILINCNINLNNTKINKLLWISIINKKYNTNYSKELDIIYSIMLQDITIIKNNKINISVKDSVFSIL